MEIVLPEKNKKKILVRGEHKSLCNLTILRTVKACHDGETFKLFLLDLKGEKWRSWQ